MKRVSEINRRSSIDVPDWIEFKPLEIPDLEGIYGMYCNTFQEWFYIGKAANIRRRLSSPYHPFKIATSINSLDFSFYFVPLSKNVRRVEAILIRTLKPIGNGGTEWGPNFTCADDIPEFKMIGYVPVTGLTCAFELQRYVEVSRRQLEEAIAALPY